MNYWDYIRVEELLELQDGAPGDDREKSNEEVVFIVVHQVYELWFKLILRELRTARDLLAQNPVPDMDLSLVYRGFRRVNTILEQAVSHFQVIETLSTRDYLGFRDHLIGASGFQSAQMRQIEVLLGLSDQRRIPLGPGGNYRDALKASDGTASPALKRVESTLQDKPSIRDALYDWLARTPVDDGAPGSFIERFLAAHRDELAKRQQTAQERAASPEDAKDLAARYQSELDQVTRFLLARDLEDADEDEVIRIRKVRAAVVFLESYRELPRLAWPREVVAAVVELEQRFIIWRQRHARMVERMIGRRVGTGGSAGVEYLDRTALTYRIFDDLWAVRTVLLRHEAVPALDEDEAFRFRVEDLES